VVGPLTGIIGAGLTEEGDTFPTDRERVLSDQCEKQAIVIQCLQNRLRLHDQELSRPHDAGFNGMSRSSEVLLFSPFSFFFLSLFFEFCLLITRKNNNTPCIANVSSAADTATSGRRKRSPFCARQKKAVSIRSERRTSTKRNPSRKGS